jgi:hypothetical protein
MKRRGLQLSRRHRQTLYAVSLTLLLSGVAWAWIQHLDQTGQAPENLRGWKTCLIALHGWSAMLFVLLFGTLLAGHVRRAWHARRNRKNGVLVVSVVGVLTLSGYALYYIGNETRRAVTSDLHLWLGIAAPVFLILHIRLGRRAATR